MTKFETIGVEYQYNADSKNTAIKCFHHSCNICCNKGIYIDCDKCTIKVAHELVIAVFDDNMNYKRRGA